MDWPDLFPKELSFCQKVKTEEGLLAILEEHSDEALVRFFEVASDDETWTIAHAAFMTALIRWFSEEFSEMRLRIGHGKRVVSQIHKHSDVLVPLLPHDIDVRVADASFSVNSLLVGVQSSFFRAFIERDYRKGSAVTLHFEDVSEQVFRIILEGANYGLVETLWRQSYEELLKILQQAGQWRFTLLVRQCSEVLRRYINEETCVEILQLAQNHALPDLREVCCEVLNNLALGAQFTSEGEADLRLRIEEFRERNLRLMQEVAPLVTQLAVRGQAGEDTQFEAFLRRCGALKVLDLSSCSGLSLDVIPLLPRLWGMNVSSCPWLDDEKTAQLLGAVQGLRFILLNENPQMGVKAFRAVTKQPALEELYCVYCSGLQDAYLETIARGCRALTTLSIAWCPKVTDTGLAVLGRHRSTLTSIDISHLSKVTNVGLLNLARPLKNLQKLVMQQLPLVTEDGVKDLLAMSPRLRQLDIRFCQINAAGIERLRAAYPKVKIIHG